MNTTLVYKIRSMVLPSLVAGLLLMAWSGAVNAQNSWHSHHHFRLHSTTFTSGETMPLSTIHEILYNGVNVCSIDGSTGGNESPELSWTGAPHRTRSFTVVMFDVTASFTHWGMYNIPASTNELPENAGVAGSPFGSQIYNDFFDQSYDGPCPPPNYPPNVHRYLVTVYALDEQLDVPSSANFPATSETLWHALLNASLNGHVLTHATIVGLYSTTPGN
ncbi:MAG: YbhB/YbcL family Raf kinase inhibitor-like protein [Gammaproteobacteria bacterium]|nr:YbhB/YbcL family Raf kinase inhibitor-like protein [Gammaproteobacteria bacterium]